MANIFPTNSNRTALKIVIVVTLAGSLLIGGFYYHSFRENRFQPEQPIAFSHKVHVGKAGMDCAACHTTTNLSAKAGIPDTKSCMDCHTHIKQDSPKIEPLRRAADPHYVGYTGQPVQWIKVNRLAGHANFNHSAHVLRGVSCVACHGDVSQQDTLALTHPKKMKWCIDCHRDPAPHLRPLETITQTDFDATAYIKQHNVLDTMGRRITDPAQLGNTLKERWKVQPKTDCNSCHH